MIDEQSGITVSEIKAKCRKIKRDRGLSAIFIDYLGLIKGDKNMSRYDLVSDNTRELKNLAKEFNVPVICLCQLSRGVEQRQDKRPMMSDLRESGEIEQTADVIAFLYRDDYYDKESDKKNIIEVIISKQRNGKTGTVELAFLKNFNAFASLDYGQRQASSSVLPPKLKNSNVSKFGRRQS
jgi:replicative DNA helicase